MSICDLKSYEIVQSRDLSDLSSKGTEGDEFPGGGSAP